MNDEYLHNIARDQAETLSDPDKKQLRFNEIVDTAKVFYGGSLSSVASGVRELVDACDKSKSDLYIKGSPMWKTLSQQYSWMVVRYE